MRESFDWLKPSPLREPDGRDFRQPDFFQPQLLEFRSDDFMEELMAAAIKPQTDSFEAAVLKPEEDRQTLKLFQPAHGRFYLVSASLSCRRPGFPEREPRKAEGENLFFVIRKFVDGAEYAWVSGDSLTGWKAVGGVGKQFEPGEERLPLLKTRSSRQDTLWFGYLPVASHLTYAVPPSVLADGDEPLDVRQEELRARFVNPLTVQSVPAATGGSQDTPLVAAANADPSGALVRDLSVFLLLDLWELFEIHLAEVAEALRDDPTSTLDGDRGALMVSLRNEQLNGTLTLATALQSVATARNALNDLGDEGTDSLGFDHQYNLATVPGIEDPNGLTKRLLDAVADALPEQLAPVDLPKFTAEQPEQTHYAIRCVYERPQCEPIRYVVSQTSLPFRLAAFFDSDAPARPVRIPLPTDVSFSGMRRFNKGVTFLISNSLQKKIDRLTGKEKELLKDDPSLNAEGDGWAFICSFSIQIIFIVAFMLLLIFVIILNFVFYWIVFFRICLPIPKKLLSG